MSSCFRLFFTSMCIGSAESSLRNPGTLPALKLHFKYLSGELTIHSKFQKIDQTLFHGSTALKQQWLENLRGGHTYLCSYKKRM